jgi:hypothetical protein
MFDHALATLTILEQAVREFRIEDESPIVRHILDRLADLLQTATVGAPEAVQHQVAGMPDPVRRLLTADALVESGHWTSCEPKYWTPVRSSGPASRRHSKRIRMWLGVSRPPDLICLSSEQST